MHCRKDDVNCLRRQAPLQIGLTIVVVSIGLLLFTGATGAADGTGAIWGRVTYYGGMPGDHPMEVCAFSGAPNRECFTINPDGTYVIEPLDDGAYTVQALVNVYTSDTSNWESACAAWYDPDGDGQPDEVTVAGGSVSGINIGVGGPWMPFDGPMMEGGEAVALAVDADDPQVVYAAVKGPGSGGNGRVFKSNDAGATWTAVYTPPVSVTDLTARGDRVCVTGFDGGSYYLFCSGDAGATWTELDPIEPNDVVHIVDLAISSEISSTLLMAGRVMDSQVSYEVSAVYRSTNGGRSWQRVFERPNPEGRHGAFYAITEDPSTPNRFFVGGTEAEPGDTGEAMASIYRVTDGNWISATQVYSSTERSPAIALAVDPGDGDVVLAATPAWFGPAGVLRSPDGGDSWTEVLAEAGAFVAIPSAGEAYAAADDGMVYVSSDGGDNWDDGERVNDHCGGYAAGTNLYAGSCAVGVLLSENGGTNWTPGDSGITSLLSPRSLAVDPFDGDHMFAATDCGGGWRSVDGGASWELDISGCIGSYAFSPRQPNVVYRGDYASLHGALERSADGGQTWEVVYSSTLTFGEDSRSEQIFFAVVPAPSRPTTVYAGGADSPDGEGRHATVVRSTQDGVDGSWTEVLSMTRESWVSALAVPANNPRVVYAGGAWQCGDEGCQGFVQRSTDGGATWSMVFTDTNEIKTIAIDAGNPRTIYAGSGSYRAFRSQDGGDTWTAVRLPPWEEGGVSGDQIVADPRAGGRIYLAGFGVVIESADGGDTWAEEYGVFRQTPARSPASLTVTNQGDRQTFYLGAEGLWSFTRQAPPIDHRIVLPAIIRAP